MRHYTLTHLCRLLVVLVSLLTLTACDKDNEPALQDKLWQIKSIRWGSFHREFRYDHMGRVISVYSAKGSEAVKETVTYQGDIIRLANIDKGERAEPFVLDDHGRLIAIVYTDGDGEAYSYDNEGRMVFADFGYGTYEYEWDGPLIHRIVSRGDDDGNVRTYTFSYSDIDNVIGFNSVDNYFFDMLYRGFYGKLTAKLPSKVTFDATIPEHLSGSGYSRTGTYTFHYTLDERKRPTRIEIKGPRGVNEYGKPYEDDDPFEITYVVK